MIISLECAGCGKEYDLDGKLAGKKARCKQCGHVFQIPVPRTMAAPSPSPARPAAPTRPSPARRAEEKPLDEFDEILSDPPTDREIDEPLDDFDEVPAPSSRAARSVAKPARARRAIRVDWEATPWAFLGAAVFGGLFAAAVVQAPAGDRATIGMVGIAAGVFTLAAALGEWRLFYNDSRARFLMNFMGRGGVKAFYTFAGAAMAVVGGLGVAGVVGSAGPGAAIPAAAGDGPIGSPAPFNAGKNGTPGADQYVELVISGPKSLDEVAVLREKIKPLVEEIGGRSTQSKWSGGAMRLAFWPASDPREVARKIDFGKVEKVAGREVFLSATPIPAEEVAAFKSKRAEEESARQAGRPAEPANAAQAAVAKAASEAGGAAPDEPEVPADADPTTRAMAGLKSSDINKKKDALRNLANSGAGGRRDEVAALLVPLIGSDDIFLATDAIKATGAWHNEEVVRALIRKLRDDRLRDKVAEALAEIKDPQAAEPLAQILPKDPWKAVDKALVALGPDAEAAVLPLLRHAEPEVRKRACTILRDVGGRAALATMKKLPADPDLGVREAANEAMRAMTVRVRSMPAEGSPFQEKGGDSPFKPKSGSDDDSPFKEKAAGDDAATGAKKKEPPSLRDRPGFGRSRRGR